MTVGTAPPLRPRGMGELLDQTIRIYRRNFLKFIGIVALVQIPISLLGLLSGLLATSGFSNPQFGGDFPANPDVTDLFGLTYFLGIAIGLIVGVLSLIAIQGVAAAVIARCVADDYQGVSVGIVDAYRRIASFGGILLTAFLLVIGIGIVLFIWMFIPCVGWLTGPGIFVFYRWVFIPLIAPIIVFERQDTLQSLRRVWDLTRQRFWWLLGFVLILTIFSQLIVVGPALLATFGFTLLTGSTLTNPDITLTLIQSFVQLVTSLLVLPITLIAMTLLYFDLRVRLEGFDLAVQSATLSAEAPLELSELTAQAPRASQEKLLTRGDLGNFSLITLGIVALYALIFALLGAAAMAIMGVASGF